MADLMKLCHLCHLVHGRPYCCACSFGRPQIGCSWSAGMQCQLEAERRVRQSPDQFDIPPHLDFFA